MKNIALEKISLVLGCLTLVSLFAKENVGTLFFIAFVLSIIVFLLKKIKLNFSLLKLSRTAVILMVVYFALGVIGVFLHPQSKTGYLTRLIPFLMSPLLFYYFYLNKSKVLILIKFFVFSNITLLLFLDLWALADMISNQSVFVIQGDREYYRFLYTRYTDPEYFNHIYLSLYSFLSSILLLQFKLFRKFFRRGLIIYILIHLFMMGSRAIVISILFAAIIYLIVLSIINKKHLKLLVRFIISILVLISTTYFFKDTLFFNRYAQVFEWYEKKDIILERNYSINNRIKLYMLGVSAVTEHHGGIQGTGIAELEIKNVYELGFKDEFSFKTDTYNTHNQYINNFLDWGYLGVIVLVWLLVIIIRDCVKQQFLWIGLFWICFAILLLMECVLFRQRGIMLFIIFYSLFVHSKSDYYLNTSNNE